MLPSARARQRIPLDGLVTRWDTDPWSLGSYSALPVGCSPAVRETLASSVIAGGIALAGEHVSVDHPATVNGALLSGRRAVENLRLRGAVGAGRAVVVIGAGVAGLAAAQSAQAAGANVVVLEARARIGGRVDTNRSWGVPVELGAAWVHGLARNPLPALVRGGGATLVPTDYEDRRVRNVRGQPERGADAAQMRLDRQVATMESRPYPLGVSVQDVLRVDGWQSSAVHRWAVETTVTEEYGLGPATLGAAALFEGSEQRGGDAMVKGGYDVVPAELGTGLRIRLETPVRSVAPTAGGGFAVTLRSGEVVRAGAVIVAVPLSVLQRGGVRISPLPTPVRRAIDGLAMGSLEKVVLRYSERWWPQTQVLGIVGGPGGRWAEWYDLTQLLGLPAVVGFSAATAAAQRPSSDAACITEAAAAFAGAFG